MKLVTLTVQGANRVHSLIHQGPLRAINLDSQLIRDGWAVAFSEESTDASEFARNQLLRKDGRYNPQALDSTAQAMLLGGYGHWEDRSRG